MSRETFGDLPRDRGKPWRPNPAHYPPGSPQNPGRKPPHDRTANLARIRAAVKKVGARPAPWELPNQREMGLITLGPLGLISSADERRLHREDVSVAADFYPEMEE